MNFGGSGPSSTRLVCDLFKQEKVPNVMHRGGNSAGIGAEYGKYILGAPTIQARRPKRIKVVTKFPQKIIILGLRIRI